MGLFSRLLLLCVLVLGAVEPAKAGQQEEAKASFTEGRRLYNMGQWKEALAAFQKAYKLSGDPALLYNLAQTYRQAGDLSQALVTYKAFLREQPNAPNRATIEARVAELEAKLKSRPETQPPAAPATRPAASATTPGAGAAPAPQAAGAAAPAPAAVAAPAPAAAAIPAAAPTGPSVVLVAPANASTSQPRAASHGWVAWVAAGATVAVGVGAVLTGLSSNSKYDGLSSTCGATSAGCTSSQIDEVKSRTLLANVLWAATGVLAVGTGITVYMTTREQGIAALWRF